MCNSYFELLLLHLYMKLASFLVASKLVGDRLFFSFGVFEFSLKRPTGFIQSCTWQKIIFSSTLLFWRYKCHACTILNSAYTLLWLVSSVSLLRFLAARLNSRMPYDSSVFVQLASSWHIPYKELWYKQYISTNLNISHQSKLNPLLFSHTGLFYSESRTKFKYTGKNACENIWASGI